jgi:hypothetical protein
MVAKQLDLDRSMLWGDRLRVLLNSSHISYGEINGLLREKGVFVDSTDKSITVPLLSSCLLTPDEFSRLISSSYTRESFEKYKTDKLTLSAQNADWRSSIIENFEDLIGGISLDSSHEFVDRPSIVSNSNNELEIKYTIKKEDFSKDWIDQELQFSGGVIISRRNGEVILELQKTHTSKETDRINGVIVKSVSNHWREKSIVKDEAPQSIKFDDFNNIERFLLFLAFTGASTKALSFEELSDIEIVRDESVGALPADAAISWMEGKVNKLHINGKKLNELGLITNTSFHKAFFLVKMSLGYKFQSGANKGTCAVVLSFSGKTAHDRDFSNTEMSISIDRISRVNGKIAGPEVRRNILRSLCDLRDSAILKIVQKRNEK